MMAEISVQIESNHVFTLHRNVCALWSRAQSRISNRQRFFTTLIVLNDYIYFANWEQLLTRIAQPRPPP